MNQPEHTPQPTSSASETECFDVLHGLDFDDVAQQISNVEAAVTKLVRNRPEAMVEDDMPAEALDDLSGLFSLSEPRKAIFTGLIYGVREDTEEDMELELDTEALGMLVDAEITFEGPEYTEFDEAQRVVFALKQTLADPETKTLTSTRYAAFAQGILQLEYMREPLLVMLARYAQQARTFVGSEDFLRASYSDQVVSLQSVAMACYDELLSYIEYDDEMTIVANASVVRKDAKKGQMAILVPRPDNVELVGQLMGGMYPEVINRGQRPFRSIDDFTFGGAPYIALRDDTMATTTYVAIDQIVTIE